MTLLKTGSYLAVFLCLGDPALCGEPSMIAAGVAQQVPMVILLNYGDGYQYSVFLNREPIYSGTGLSSVRWSDDPLKSGTNEIRYVAELIGPRHDAEPRCDINLVDERGQSTIGEVEASLQGESRLDRTFSFHLERINNHNVYDQIQSGSPDFTNQVKQFSLKLARAISSRDPAGIARLISVDENTLKGDYPEWFFDRTAQAAVTAVGSVEDIEVLVGERLALARASRAFLEKRAGAGLSSISNTKTGVQLVKHCLVFCKKQGRLCLILSNSAAVPVQF